MLVIVYLILGSIMAVKVGWGWLTGIWFLCVAADLGITAYIIAVHVYGGRDKESGKWNWEAITRKGIRRDAGEV